MKSTDDSIDILSDRQQFHVLPALTDYLYPDGQSVLSLSDRNGNDWMPGELEWHNRPPAKVRDR